MRSGAARRAQEAADRDDHDRRERRLGQVGEQRRQERAREQHQSGGDERGELRSPARAVGGGGLARAAGLDEARREPGQQVRRAERRRGRGSASTCSRRCVASERATPIASALTSRTPSDAPTSWRASSRLMSGSAGSGSASGQVADDVDAVRGEVEQRRHARSPAPARRSVAGTPGAQPAAGHQDGDAPDADRDRRGVDVAEVAEQLHSRPKNSPSPASTPRIAGSWPIMIVRPRPNRKPVITGLDTRSATAPSRRSPAATSTAAVDERERRRERREMCGVAARERRDRRRRHAPTSPSSRSPRASATCRSARRRSARPAPPSGPPAGAGRRSARRPRPAGRRRCRSPPPRSGRPRARRPGSPGPSPVRARRARRDEHARRRAALHHPRGVIGRTDGESPARGDARRAHRAEAVHVVQPSDPGADMSDQHSRPEPPRVIRT